MPEGQSFTTTLVRMLQNGAYKEWLGCPAGECTQVEFRLQQVYHVHVGAKHIVIKEQDVETVRHQNQGQWKWFRPTVSQTRRIVLDRASGKILEAPNCGKLQERKKPAASSKAPRQKRSGVLVTS